MERMQNATDLSILTAAQLMAADRPPRSDLLPPWLASDTAALVYGPPGIGKSFLALGIAWAVARRQRAAASSAGAAARPRRVLYVDGEMGAAELQRSPRPVRAAARPPRRIVAHDRPGGARLDLGAEDGIVRLMAGWNDPQLVVLDTLSALTPSARADRDPERRDGLHCFLLHLKQSRRAVLMVDHADKRGALNAAARRASAADLVMALRPPGPGAAGGNARFEIHFEKTRQRVPLLPILAELRDGGRRRRLALGRGLPRRAPRGAGHARAQPARRVRGARHRAQLVLQAQGRGPRARAAAAEGDVMSDHLMSAQARQARGLRAARHDRSRLGQRGAGRR